MDHDRKAQSAAEKPSAYSWRPACLYSTGKDRGGNGRANIADLGVPQGREHKLYAEFSKI